MISIEGNKQQTMLDISIKYYGSPQGIKMLVEDNVYDGESIANLDNLEGKVIRIREGVEIDKSITGYFKNKEIVTS